MNSNQARPLTRSTGARALVLAVACASLSAVWPASAVAQGPTLAEETVGLLRTTAVSGREGDAASYLRSRLAGLDARTDSLGDVVLSLGHGAPRRLLACAMDEPGFVVSAVTDDGFLRLSSVGQPRSEALWAQFREGQKVTVRTADGPVAGAVGVPSIHLNGARADAAPFGVEDAWVDVGATSREDVSRLGIALLDPVALVRRIVRMPGGLLAAPSAASKGECVALADAARRIAAGGTSGTTVVAWTVQGRRGRRGLGHVLASRGPFDAVVVTGALGGRGAPGSARVFALSSRYTDTPVETIDVAGVIALSDSLVAAAGVTRRTTATAAPIPRSDEASKTTRFAMLVDGAGGAGPAADDSLGGAALGVLERPAGRGAAAADSDGSPSEADVAHVLAALIGRYGVSGDEARVHALIRSLLPDWAHPTVDAKGNVVVTVGQGSEHVAFVAHMDEVGFRIDSIRPDGRLVLSRRGGLYPSLWEGQAALVHTGDRDVPAIFEPRADHASADRRTPSTPLTAWTGEANAGAVRALGIRVGQTVTMPKRMLRIGEHRALARGFDDRAGDAALLLALRRIDPSTLQRRVTFAWVVEEEVGLNGSTALAAEPEMGDVGRAYAVDTFVSSDAPLESRRYADDPLGDGPVVRVLDSSTFTPRRALDETLAAARTRGIRIQYGMTSGGTDATPFTQVGALPIPISWPGRYSHSPVEVLDLRDVSALTRLIVALAYR